MKKVKFTCDWCSDYELKLRMERSYRLKDYIYNFQITTGNDYDLLVSINKPVYDKTSRVLGVLMEPSWFLNNKLDSIYNTCDHVLSYNKHTNYSNNIYYPGILPMQLNYDTGQDLEYYLNRDYTKTKLCSMIVSRDKTSYNDNVLYNKRIKLAENILKTDLPIDIYGKGWDAYTSSDTRVKGSLDLNSKYLGVQEYKYSIAIENTSEGDYFTEKVTDCLLVNTIPIYYGCNNINNFFKTPISLMSLDSVEEVASIIKVENKFYKEDKILIGNKYNLFIAISKYIDYL
jgi:hypothetical protein